MVTKKRQIPLFALGAALGLVVGFRLGLYLVARRKGEGAEVVMAYCLKCRAKRAMRRPQVVTMKDGRLALRGTCPHCGGGMFRFIKAAGHQQGGPRFRPL